MGGGRREELVAYLKGKQQYTEQVRLMEKAGEGDDVDDVLREHAALEARELERDLERLDRTRTTSRLSGRWDDDGVIYEQRGWCSRANVFTLTRRLLEAEADGKVHVCDLLEPFEDDGEREVRCDPRATRKKCVCVEGEACLGFVGGGCTVCDAQRWDEACPAWPLNNFVGMEQVLRGVLEERF